MPSDDEPRKGQAKQAFDQAAPKTGHTSRVFNRAASVPPAHYTRDIRKHRPTGPGFGPPGQAMRFKKAAHRYDTEQDRGKKQRDMVSLSKQFNTKAKPRER